MKGKVVRSRIGVSAHFVRNGGTLRPGPVGRRGQDDWLHYRVFGLPRHQCGNRLPRHPTCSRTSHFGSIRSRFVLRDNRTPYGDSSYVLRHGTQAPRYVHLQDCLRFVTVDLAISMKATADFTVIAVWAVDGHGTLLLLDLLRERLEAPDIAPRIKKARMAQWQCSFTGVESTAFQLAIVQQLRREGLAVQELRAHRDKVARSVAAQVRMEAGTVWFPEGAGWLPTLETELLLFPAGSHDDMVDALSYAADMAGDLTPTWDDGPLVLGELPGCAFPDAGAMRDFYSQNQGLGAHEAPEHRADGVYMWRGA